MGGAAGAPLGERLDTHADTSHWTASDPGIHHAPRVMAPVVGRAAERSGDGTLAAFAPVAFTPWSVVVIAPRIDALALAPGTLEWPIFPPQRMDVGVTLVNIQEVVDV